MQYIAQIIVHKFLCRHVTPWVSLFNEIGQPCVLCFLQHGQVSVHTFVSDS